MTFWAEAATWVHGMERRAATLTHFKMINAVSRRREMLINLRSGLMVLERVWLHTSNFPFYFFPPPPTEAGFNENLYIWVIEIMIFGFDSSRFLRSLRESQQQAHKIFNNLLPKWSFVLTSFLHDNLWTWWSTFRLTFVNGSLQCELRGLLLLKKCFNFAEAAAP